MTHFPKFKRFIGKQANHEKLNKLIDTPDSCWSFEDSLNTYTFTFVSLLGCKADNPPLVVLNVSLKNGIVRSVEAHVHLFVFNPPCVGYQQCGTPPVGKDLQHIRQVLESVLEV